MSVCCTRATITLPSAALRAASLQLLGSGQGSVTTAGIVEELPGLADEITARLQELSDLVLG